MTITCPQCSYVNPDQSGFCVRCGNRLQPGNQSSSSSSQPPYAASVAAPPAAYSAPLPGPSYQSSSLPYGTQAYPAQMGSGQGTASIRRAFAGYGIPIMHYSWLLNGDEAQAVTIRSNIRD